MDRIYSLDWTSYTGTWTCDCFNVDLSGLGGSRFFTALPICAMVTVRVEIDVRWRVYFRGRSNPWTRATLALWVVSSSLNLAISMKFVLSSMEFVTSTWCNQYWFSLWQRRNKSNSSNVLIDSCRADVSSKYRAFPPDACFAATPSHERPEFEK